MKVLVVSDTHKKNDNYFKLVERYKPDLVIHCGDSEGSEYALTECAGCPVQIVLGNNDFFSYLPREVELTLEGFKIWVTHGHNYYVSMGNELLKREALARGANIVLYGHTHRPVVDKEGSVIAVNPGSLSYPRQEGHKPSYVIMNLKEGKADFSIRYL